MRMLERIACLQLHRQGDCLTRPVMNPNLKVFTAALLQRMTTEESNDCVNCNKHYFEVYFS